jgi:SAM-dependent methyltransferase
MSLSAIYKKQQFLIKPYSILINPFFIIRAGLYSNLKKIAPKLTGNLLDFGCGTKPYRSLFTNLQHYIGLDIENEGHPHENEPIDVFYDGKTIPFPDQHFDSIFSSEVFEHVFDIEPILNELNRVLKTNGQLLISLPFAWNEHEIPNDFARYTSFGIKHILEKAGFEVTETKKTGHFAAVIAQYITLFIYELIKTKNKYINIMLNILFISPFSVTGFIISYIMPRNTSLYFNNIILAKKKKRV